jgi:geranylgeranyl pyrophosphate synthase
VPKADSLEAALEAAIRRFDGTSPVTPQVHYHFGYAGDAGAPHARLRMQLVLEVVAEEQGDPADGVDVACAVEILHESIVVHDTVEGGAWSRFGLAHGINAGDAVSAMAYLQLLEGPPRRPAEQTILMTRALHAANFELCGGDRTAIFAVACELGALVAGASAERARDYAKLGRISALALQMQGDVQTADLTAADALASRAGIDAGGRVRAFFARVLRPAA